jgi:hypothetical protein
MFAWRSVCGWLPVFVPLTQARSTAPPPPQCKTVRPSPCTTCVASRQNRHNTSCHATTHWVSVAPLFVTTLTQFRFRVSSVGIASHCGLHGLGFELRRGQGVFCYLKRPNRPWAYAPSSGYRYRYRYSFQGVKRPEHDSYHQPAYSAEVTISGAVRSVPPLACYEATCTLYQDFRPFSDPHQGGSAVAGRPS